MKQQDSDARLGAGKADLGFAQGEPRLVFAREGQSSTLTIEDFDAMKPFLMSLVSEGDHWLFISSTGALTAGRRDPDHALFPYVTDDRIHAAAGQTGSKTILKVIAEGRSLLWEPFSDQYEGLYRIRRSLSKSVYGDQLGFEEVNEDLGLSFQYSWTTSWKYGFVRRAKLLNLGNKVCQIELLDGLVDIMPAELTRRFQADFSTLADGYRDCELAEVEGRTGLKALALYRLSSIPTDHAEPCEALRANVVWSWGLATATMADKATSAEDALYLDGSCLEAFKRGRQLPVQTRLRGRRGAYLERAALSLGPGEERSWYTVADVANDAADIEALMQDLKEGDPAKLLEEDMARGRASLRQVAAAVDGLQESGDRFHVWRHYSNALFNAMRGGYPPSGYLLDARDFAAFVGLFDKALAKRQAAWLEKLPETIQRSQLIRLARASGEASLERLAREYLPLSFSRRHGDPSRPWNSFSIATKDREGKRLLGYEGNWRDIFQNWEALALSYPGYLDGMIFKFLNCSTADGYNPYRITRGGLDWEVQDPADAWSFIGYWGDHQAVYLLRLLKAHARYWPGDLAELLDRRLFVYVQVPYRLKGYEDLVRDPKDSVIFDDRLHEELLARARTVGEDGKLLRDARGEVCRVSLAEKLLVPLLSKLASFVPEGGIWMNTQRPEWNDANNALVGNGLSVVTLCYIRGLLAFAEELFSEVEASVEISVEVLKLLRQLRAVFEEFPPASEAMSARTRRSLMDRLGWAGGEYRQNLYQQGLSGLREKVPCRELADFCHLAKVQVQSSIARNRREDGLYHAYNLLALDGEGATIRRLSVMLEGQVAILSSGMLSPAQSLEVLGALRSSPLYREDQGSYLLYPDRQLPGFLAKNRLAADRIQASRLLKAVLEAGDQRLGKLDSRGAFRFNADFHCARDLAKALDQLASEAPPTGPAVPASSGESLARLAEAERDLVLGLYEECFDHKAFTGRSGTFYKYEGLGSIYWHMVSKLLVATGETLDRARDESAETSVIEGLLACYRDIREGLGVHKDPKVYGAFPIDPYSHTPSFAGVQQPGLTGQVKEDLLSRFGELGVLVRDGMLRFRPGLAASEEALESEGSLCYVDSLGSERGLNLPAHSYGFTLCQLPIRVIVDPESEEDWLELAYRDGRQERIRGLALDREASKALFLRESPLMRLDVHFPAAYHDAGKGGHVK